MPGFIATIIVGIICILIGISNCRGNISTLHSYHRSRVSEEDIRPFGKLVGLGTIIIGCSVAAYGIFSVISLLSDIQFLIYLGMGIMFVGLAVGLLISFYAMKKYNKGIF